MNPSAHKPLATRQIMLRVALALVPGSAVASVVFGVGVLVNLALALLFAALFEWLGLRLRGSATDWRQHDGSTLISAALIALALPPLAPWWLLAGATAGAILLAKHAYGGLGQNLFNPAMAGYALVAVLFPAQLAHWPASAGPFDAHTAATTLDTFRQNDALTVLEWWNSHPQFGRWGGSGWEWINLAFLGGGLYLLQQRIIGWHMPAGVLAALALMAVLFYDNGSSASGGSPLYHLLTGATMLGAFFVATDPVTAPLSATGRLLAGTLVGVLIYTIRSWGHYPDGVAFAVLAMNAIAPLLDRGLRALQRHRAAPGTH